MIAESVIAKECSAKTFARARNVAVNSGFIYNRRCDYEPGVTVLRACVESTSWSDYPYDVHLELNEEEGSIVDYECTCPAHSRYPGMCKHAAGLILLFNEEPHTFKGYSENHILGTSRSISALLKRAAAQMAVGATDEQEGHISLELYLESSQFDRWSASFKIASPAASYVLKDVGELLERVQTGAYHEYGKRLAFTHTLSSFTPQARDVIKMLQRYVDGQPDWAKRSELQELETGRYVYLGPSAVIELLDLYQDVTFQYSDFTLGDEFRAMHIVDQDPQLELSIVELESSGFELVRGNDLGFIASGKRLYAWDSNNFYRCSESLAACGDFLENVYSGGEERLTVSAKDMPAFCAAVLPTIEEPLHVKAPESIEALRPVPCELEFYLDIQNGQVQCEAKAIYGQSSCNPFTVGAVEGQSLRDDAKEGLARTVVSRYLPSLGEDGLSRTRGDDDMARLLFHGLAELQRIGAVYMADDVKALKRSTMPTISCGVSVKSNLLELSYASDKMSADEIAALLESYRQKKSYHRLKDGTFIDLEGGLAQDMGLDALDILADELGLGTRQIEEGKAGLEAHHAFLLDTLIEEERKEASFKAFISSFEERMALRHELPASLATTLRPYQIKGFDWLNALADLGLGGILADEMGLGKSLQVITMLLHRREELSESGPALIVCPASLVYNWTAEFAKFAPDMRVAALAGNRDERAALRDACMHEVLVTSYDLLRIDAKHMAAIPYSFFVIDEAQYIKNHSTQSAKAVKQVQAKHRIALTGTPVENRLSELWSIFDFLMPGMLGPYRTFRDRYEQPIIDGDSAMAQRLRAKVGPFILRRLKTQVLDDLPDKMETVVKAQLEGEQRTLYDAHEQRLLQSLSEKTTSEVKGDKISVLAELTKLRQICCDPRLLFQDYKSTSAKLDTISELIESAIDAGEKVLVFSQFTSFLDLISQECARHGWDHFTITGSTPKAKRIELVDAFNANDIPVFLISLKAGGTGLNLTGASIVIHADPWWNAAAQNQATDRAHRIGQTKDVSVFKVIAAQTVEERIIELQEAKSDLADQILGGEASSLGSLSKDELVRLLARD